MPTAVALFSRVKQISINDPTPYTKLYFSEDLDPQYLGDGV